MSQIPSTPKQLTLACCEPPVPHVPDWETLDEAVRTAVRTALTRLIERLATASGEERECE